MSLKVYEEAFKRKFKYNRINEDNERTYLEVIGDDCGNNSEKLKIKIRILFVGGFIDRFLFQVEYNILNDISENKIESILKKYSNFQIENIKENCFKIDLRNSSIDVSENIPIKIRDRVVYYKQSFINLISSIKKSSHTQQKASHLGCDSFNMLRDQRTGSFLKISKEEYKTRYGKDLDKSFASFKLILRS